MTDQAQPQQPSPAPIDAARSADLQALIELLYSRLPAWWMRKVSKPELETFLAHAILDERCALLVARGPDGAPVAYAWALRDVKRFWRSFALRRPALMTKIAYHVASRRLERRGLAASPEAPGFGGDGACLPRFSWSASAPDAARILGLFVRPDHRRKGIALALYTQLFEILRAAGAVKVEEYMGEDYPQYAGKFPNACGWEQRRCACGGYKLSKSL